MALNDCHSRRAVTETLNLPVLRQKNGVKLRDISESTKIGVRFLEAIEAEEFEKLPGGVFTTSYLRQYALAAGLDPEELIRHYQRRMELEPGAGTGSKPAPDSGWRRVLANLIVF